MRQKGMNMDLTTEQITTLHERLEVLVDDIRLAAGRIGDINLAIQNKQLPQGVSFDEIGKPISERP
jgi:hypothetical protein